MTIMDHDFSSGAILWHCTEGKDRCGLVTALVLEMLGVDRADIMADYLKTNDVNLPKAIKIKEQLAQSRGEAFAESVYQAFIADSTYLESAWGAMGDNYLDKIGLKEEDIRVFRAKVLCGGLDR